MSDLKENKKVLVMFSGIGPYSFTALKKQPNLARVTSIEINPEGHKYALENRVLNRNIVKKSKLYKDILKFLKVNKLPIYEKKLIEIVNELRMHFINGDVRVEVDKLKLDEHVSEVLDTHNALFGQSPNDLFEFLKVAEFKEIKLDFDKIEVSNDLLNLIVMFSQKFDFVCKINSQWYEFKDELRKGYLVNFLEEKIRSSAEVSLMDVPLFDEIYMPLPKDAELFLDCAFKVASKGAVVHMYDFLHENDFPHLSENAVLKAGKVAGRAVEIIGTRKVGQYSPRKYRVCCDFKIID